MYDIFTLYVYILLCNVGYDNVWCALWHVLCIMYYVLCIMYYISALCMIYIIWYKTALFGFVELCCWRRVLYITYNMLYIIHDMLYIIKNQRVSDLLITLLTSSIIYCILYVIIIHNILFDWKQRFSDLLDYVADVEGIERIR